MNKRARLATVSVAMVVMAGLALAEEKKGSTEAPSRETIAEYRKWTKVNAEPKSQPPARQIPCAAPSGRDDALKGNPHKNQRPIETQITVYVNELGQHAMTQENPTFPVGTVIVKEKMPGKQNPNEPPYGPELLTVMAKQQAGYDTEHGDWEYLTLDGEAKQITFRGKLENCRECHDGQKKTDYIFRDYMTDKDRERLGSTTDKSTSTNKKKPN